MFTLEDLVKDAAKQYLTVKGVHGTEINAICPFHLKANGRSETRPSFYLSTSTGLFFCHSCQESGNILQLLERMGVSARDRQRYIPLMDTAKVAAKQKEKDAVVLEPLPEATIGLFDEYTLPKFHPSVSKQFQVLFDKKHDRIVYPLRTYAGKLMGFSGRNPDGIRPKYKIYTDEFKAFGLPEREGWNRRDIVWNLHRVYQEKTDDPIVCVEGFKACMAVYQASVPSVVALLGTYLTLEAEALFARLGRPVILFLDNNEAGKVGTVKTAEKLCRHTRVRIAPYPDRLQEEESAQPDSLTPEEIQWSVTNALPYTQWLLSPT